MEFDSPESSLEQDLTDLGMLLSARPRRSEFGDGSYWACSLDDQTSNSNPITHEATSQLCFRAGRDEGDLEALEPDYSLDRT